MDEILKEEIIVMLSDILCLRDKQIEIFPQIDEEGQEELKICYNILSDVHARTKKLLKE